MAGLDADRANLQERERSLISSEPDALGAPLSADSATASPAKVAAFLNSPDDLLRAVIAREVLGPPLSARNRR
jgi:hypothetical protein